MNKKWMQRCLHLAKKGQYGAAPNPMVGSVLVYNNRIIGEGFHQAYGGPHAEVNAFANVKTADEVLLQEAILYVSLEPCAHYGLTPPCAELVVKKKVKKVVIACTDPNPKVFEKGINIIREAGIEVEIGLLQAEAVELNKRFITVQQKKRPYIVLKFAQSQDGFMAGDTDEPIWLSNELTRYYTHKWRALESAILVGRKTAAIDNPSLNVRNWSGAHPLRVVLDRENQLDKNLYLFDGNIPTLVFTETTTPSALNNVSFIHIDFTKNVWQQIFTQLHLQKIQSVLIEGGTKVLQSLVDENLWDEARIFTATNTYLRSGKKAPLIVGKKQSEKTLRDNLLTIYRNTL